MSLPNLKPAITRQQDIERQNRGKEATVLNIPESMSERIIQNAREKIAQVMKSKENLMPTYEEKRAFFIQVEKEWDDIRVQMENFDDEIDEQQKLIDVMNHYEKVRTEGGKLHVMRSVEHKDGIRSAKRVSWIDESVDVLATTKRFMHLAELYHAIEKLPHVKEQLVQMKSYAAGSLKATVMNNLAEHAYTSVSGRPVGPNFKATLGIYNEKIGLIEWFDDKFVPKPQYMKEFMYENTLPLNTSTE